MQAQILILLVTLVKNLKLKILGVLESSKPPGKEKSDECFDALKLSSCPAPGFFVVHFFAFI